MPSTNDKVAVLLTEYGDLLSILGQDPFKPRAYDKAARAVAGHPIDLQGMDLREILAIPGVGKSIGEKIREYLTTGRIAELDALRAKIPPGVRELMGLSGMGPKKAMTLYQELGVASIPDLEQAIEAGRVADLKGFGGKTEENLRRALGRLRSSSGRVRIDIALGIAEGLVEALEGSRGVRKVAYAGSLRRGRETIGDIDLLVATSKPEPVMETLVSQPGVTRVLARGEAKASVLTDAGLQVDLRAVPMEAWGAAMIYFTGSKAHNVRIRELAVRAGLKLNEYGLFDAATGDLLTSATEEQVYERLGMSFIPPQLREDRGEVEAALSGTIPSLVSARNLKGDLHTHTDLTDGVAPLARMLDAAAALGYRYYAVTDHAPDLWMQRMTDEKMLAQRREIRSIQDRYPRMTLLHGTELNIGPEGNVDWDEEFLAGFDITVASIHSHFDLARADQTARLIRAIENPRVHVIGHPTARRIGGRDPIDVDLEAVFGAAARTNTAIEINSHPERLDLRDEHIMWARRHGVKFAIDTDAHAAPHLQMMRYGIAQAQRGWLEPAEVVNTWPLARLRRFLASSGDTG